jgi:hypothetical protein
LDILEDICDVALREIGQVAQLLTLLQIGSEEGLRTLLVLEENIKRLGIVEDGVEGLREAELHHVVEDALACRDSREVCRCVYRFADVARLDAIDSCLGASEVDR